ncbi:hypothetical protein C5L14_06595 [Labrys okinawensis]|uniref:Uncharacterized protein n=1 Tax=Labrys okinawensis TaxID=346911 RepID=A0A2S9QHQ9_9HYPH|nr:hypothetical protein [Labrys okinawensis]PRH88878.1 hypothetical protein C5L14_06595 [Labrys okinawensis]
MWRALLAVLLGIAMTTMAQAANYAVGQIWSYRTRAGEENSRVIIDKIEDARTLGKIYHVTIKGVKVKNPKIAGGISDTLQHLPLSQASLDGSVLKLIGTGKSDPSFQEGYREWKTAFDGDKAGIWTVSIEKIVGAVEKAINQ